jgi:hypothetical protein
MGHYVANASMPNQLDTPVGIHANHASLFSAYLVHWLAHPSSGFCFRFRILRLQQIFFFFEAAANEVRYNQILPYPPS